MAIGSEVWATTLAQFRACGSGRDECVVYWVGPAVDPRTVTRAVHPKHIATPFHYRVNGGWLTHFWFELARTRESVRIQVHTHGGRACHSRTDDEGALVYQAGFLSLVLPGFALRDDCRDRAFLTELDDRGRWREVAMHERLTWT